MANSNMLPLSSAADMAALRREYGGDGLMGRSIARLQARMDSYLGEPIDVPGHGEAGSYEHNRHQLNYQLCEAAGLLYQITGEKKYSDWAAELIGRYADVYLKMGFQQQKNTNPPGRIFHQLLNENMWLLYMSLGYAYIKDTLTAERCKYIEDMLFRPMVEMFTVKYAHDFDRIHNHGLWAVAAVGICGLAIGESRYVDQVVDGQFGDRKTAGYMAQISQLFAPSGYYIEGPYYHRFAIRPLLLLSEALHLHRPELDIYNVKGQVIRTTIEALLATAYPNGCFPALNDASRTMGVHDEGVLISAAVYHARYGSDIKITALARQQNQVWIQPSALALAREAQELENPGLPYWPSVELNEGPEGDRGAQGFLRAKAADGDITQLIMNYGQHGMGHGHFDTLGITLFNRGDEVLREYGYGRWVNVETKFGGRYLDENKTWARQTVAHNCVAVDRKCQNSFDVKRADSVHGLPHFFVGTGDVQGMSAFANHHHDGVRMQRSLLLLNLPAFETPVVIDLFRLTSDTEHEYDYALQYAGQISDTTVPYEYNRTQWNALGTSDGYQHLMGVAQGAARPGSRLTWIQGKRFNSWLMAAEDGEIIIAQTGGMDPSFNIRREDTFILRQRGKDHLFASAFETHGLFDESVERCYGARPTLESIRIIGHNAEASVVEVKGKNVALTIMVSNKPGVTADSRHEVSFNGQTYAWQGFYACKQA